MILTRQIYKRVNFPKYLGNELVSCQKIVHLRNFLDVKKRDLVPILFNFP